MNVQYVLHVSAGFAGICLHCCFSVAFLEQFVADRDKELPVRGPLCLRRMGTRVKRACENNWGNYTFTQTQMYCVCGMGMCMHAHPCTCVQAEEEKVGSADIAPKRRPLSSQTQPHWILICTPEWLGWWQLQQLTARLGRSTSDKNCRQSRGSQQKKVKLSWKLNAPQKHNAIGITAVDTEPGASVFLSGFISNPSCIRALSCHWPPLK